MKIDNQFVLCRNVSEVDGQMQAFGEEGYHLVSMVRSQGQWYLAFSNWVSIQFEEQTKKEQRAIQIRIESLEAGPM